MKNRCPWPADDDLMIKYHDTEWGVPLHDDRKLFEFMVLDAFQAGLSWKTVLHKREAFREAFDNFNPAKIAKYDGASWSPLSTGLNNTVRALAFAPNGDLYIGGAFTDAAYPWLCRWNGSAFSVVGTNTDLNSTVTTLAFGVTGWLYVGGMFANAGGIANADYIARWSGSAWESLGSGLNGSVLYVVVDSGKVYISGYFTTAGGLTLTDRVAVWSNGAWQPIDIDLPGSDSIFSILPASDGSLYIGGSFSTVGEDPDENAECGIVSDRVYEIGVASASANTYPFMQVRGPGTLKAITN